MSFGIKFQRKGVGGDKGLGTSNVSAIVSAIVSANVSANVNANELSESRQDRCCIRFTANKVRGLRSDFARALYLN